MLDTFRKTFYLVGRDNPARWVALIAGAVAVSGLEMLGALLIYLLLTLVVDPTGELALPLVGDLRAHLGDVDQTGFLLWAALGMGLFFVLRAAFQIAYAYAKHRVAVNAGARLSARLAHGYLQLPYRFHLRRSSSELVRNAQQTVEQLSLQCFLPVIIVIAEGLLVVGLLAVMLLVAPLATTAATVLLGSVALLLLKLVQPRLKHLGAEAQDRRKRTLASLQQALYGIRDIKVLGVERHFSEDYRASYDRFARATYLRGMAADLPRLVIETALIVFILALFALSVAVGTATQELLSTLGLFAYAGLRIQPSLQKLIAGLNHVKFSAPAVDDVHADLLLVEETLGPDEDVGHLPFTREIRLRDVGFTYEGADRPAIDGLNLTIRAGERIGICGPTGGGKTTLADLIVGLLEPTAGRVTVDGVDLAAHRTAWFRNLGVVPQLVFLIDDTLRRNIALGVPDEQIDDDAVMRAIDLAQLRTVVEELPQGLETVVGERGVRLSGGQRQRVAIARALYRDPAVIVLDEGTSALDSATEAVLVSALEQLGGERTLIMIAHRLSTVERCNRVVLVAHGGVRAMGTYRELAQMSTEFRALLDPEISDHAR